MKGFSKKWAYNYLGCLETAIIANNYSSQRSFTFITMSVGGWWKAGAINPKNTPIKTNNQASNPARKLPKAGHGSNNGN